MNVSLPTLSLALIPLLKGVVYQDQQPDVWNHLLNEQAAVRDYLTVIGLQLFIDETEGYAFLRQIDTIEENETPLPRLLQRRPLSYPVSLLCILLRKKLIEQDAAGGDTRAVLSHEQIINMMSVFLPERSNEIKTIEQIESCINKLIEFGFLRRMRNDEQHYEIRRIIKALVDADWLSAIDKKLEEYQHHATN